MKWFKRKKNSQSEEKIPNQTQVPEKIVDTDDVDEETDFEEQGYEGTETDFCDWVYNFGLENGLIPPLEVKLPKVSREQLVQWLVKRRYIMSLEPLSLLDPLGRFRALVNFKNNPTACIEVRAMLFYYLLTSRFPEYKDDILIATSPVARDHYIVKSILDYIDYNRIGGDEDELRKLQRYIYWLEMPSPIILLPGTKAGSFVSFDPLLSIFSTQIPIYFHTGKLIPVPVELVESYFEGYLIAAQVAVEAKDAGVRDLEPLSFFANHPMTPVVSALSVRYSGRPDFPEAHDVIMYILKNRPELLFLQSMLRNNILTNESSKIIQKKYGDYFLVEPKKRKKTK